MKHSQDSQPAEGKRKCVPAGRGQVTRGEWEGGIFLLMPRSHVQKQDQHKQVLLLVYLDPSPSFLFTSNIPCCLASKLDLREFGASSPSCSCRGERRTTEKFRYRNGKYCRAWIETIKKCRREDNSNVECLRDADKLADTLVDLLADSLTDAFPRLAKNVKVARY